MMLAPYATAASAEPLQVSNPNGTISGSIDGHVADLLVLFEKRAGILTIFSHVQTVSKSKTFEGIELAVSFVAPETGFQFVGFIDGKHYKFLRASDSIDIFPFTLVREVCAHDYGKINVDLTLICLNI